MILAKRRRARARKFVFVVILSAVSLLGLLSGCTSSQASDEQGSGFVQASGNRLSDASGERLVLHGMTFQNWLYAPDEPLATHHDERDYARVADMGLNSIQFTLSYRWFEDDDRPFDYKSSGFEWLDQNVAWAKAHGLLLILALAEPPGGLQQPCGQGTALWNAPENQTRLVELWNAIAERYADESTIAAYNPLTVASPTESMTQWQELATRIVTRIRESDEEHLIVVGPADSVDCQYVLPRSDAFPIVFAPNLAYGFFFNEPFQYTAQLLDFSGLADWGRYPDDSRLTLDWGHVSDDDGWLGWTVDSTPGPLALRLKPDETAWTYKAFTYTVVDPDYDFANLVLTSDDNPGTVCFDDIVVTEYAGEFGDASLVGTVFDIDPEVAAGWYLWEEDPKNGTAVVSSGQDSVRGSGSVCLSGTNMPSNISGEYVFPTTPGQTFEVSYWIKGESSDPDGSSLVKLDFFDYDIDLSFRNRAFLERSLADHFEWSAERGVPLYAYEIGTGSPTFANDKGGLEWVRDMLDIARGNGLSFSYNNYHSEAYGLYRGDAGLPDAENANQPLIDLFTETLH